jgi:hypothetical protein
LTCWFLSPANVRSEKGGPASRTLRKFVEPGRAALRAGISESVRLSPRRSANAYLECNLFPDIACRPAATRIVVR